MTLYDLNIQFATILEMAEDGDIDPQLIADTLEGVEGDIEAKLDSYGVVVNELLTDAAKIDTEIKRLMAKKKVINNNIDRMKSAVMATMVNLDKKKVAGERFTWQIQKNGGKAPLIFDDWFDTLALPEDLQDWEVTPDKDAIRKALEEGADIEGVRIGERGESLRLK